MNIPDLLIALGFVGLASYVIMRACDHFDEGSSYLGRNMPPGVKGATINAIGSSLPELLTTSFLLFMFHDEDGFSAGIATCAGSAVFNAIIIPAACILVVTYKGIAPHIEISRKTIIRDGSFFIAAEVLLIFLLGDHEMAWWAGLSLMMVYLGYFGYLMYQFKTEEEEQDWTHDDSEMTTGLAWLKLCGSTAVIALACYVLSEAVVLSAHALKVPTYFTAVILAAAATSVPDTILSMKDAMRGEYDDAVSNAIGSNIFDITVALGLPLFIYGLIHGSVNLSAIGDSANVQELRIALLLLTGVGLGIFLVRKHITKLQGWLLVGLYGFWLAFIFVRAIQHESPVTTALAG